MIASLGHYISQANPHHFQPMNAIFGILNSLIKDRTKKAEAALEAIDAFVSK